MKRVRIWEVEKEQFMNEWREKKRETKWIVWGKVVKHEKRREEICEKGENWTRKKKGFCSLSLSLSSSETIQRVRKSVESKVKKDENRKGKKENQRKSTNKVTYRTMAAWNNELDDDEFGKKEEREDDMKWDGNENYQNALFLSLIFSFFLSFSRLWKR